MPQRNNPMSAVQKKRTVSTTKKKGTTSSSKTFRTSKKEQMKHRTVMPVWIRNILAVMIVGCFSIAFYYFFIRPYAYRWKPCHGLKEYGVCIPDGYDIHGIDISHYQGKIDWKKVAADGIDFAFIRVGFRGSSEGKLVEDEYFIDNIEGALENHIEVGVYFYTQAVTTEEAKEEAQFLLDLLEPYDITYPVVLDLEEVNGKSRTDDMTQEDFTDAAIEFLDTVEKAGYRPMIYGNLKTFFIMLDMSRIEKYDKWFAYYQTPVYFPYEFTIWQYSSTGKVDGIKGDVDLNVSMKEY